MEISPAFQRFAKFLVTPMDTSRTVRTSRPLSSAPRVPIWPQITRRLARSGLTVLVVVGIFAIAGIGIAVGELGASGLAPLPRIGWLVTASSGANSFQAVDGSEKTCWSTAEPQHRGQLFDIDMGHPWEFNRVQLNGTAAPRDYQVFVSNNGRRYHKLAITYSGKPSALTIVCPKQVARYVRIRQTGSNRRLPWSIYELNIFNDAPLLNRYFLSKH